VAKEKIFLLGPIFASLSEWRSTQIIALHLPTVANKQASRSQPVEQHRTNNSA